MSGVKSYIKLSIGLILLASIPVLYLNIYKNFQDNYFSLKQSGMISETQLSQQMALGQELALTNENLNQQIFQAKDQLRRTKTLLSSVEAENTQLRQKIELMGQMSDLEATIAGLKERNAQIEMQMREMQQKQASLKETPATAKTIAQAKAWIKEYMQKIRQFKGRIQEIRQEERTERIAAQQEQDRVATLNGNQGFLVRDGKQAMPEGAKPVIGKTVNVEVRFVE